MKNFSNQDYPNIFLILIFQGERATGYGVALLPVMFGYASQDEHLRYLCPLKETEDLNQGGRTKKMKIG